MSEPTVILPQRRPRISVYAAGVDEASISITTYDDYAHAMAARRKDLQRVGMCFGHPVLAGSAGMAGLPATT